MHRGIDMEGKKVLLVHHGGHRGGYGVCWDLRTKLADSIPGKDSINRIEFKLADLGFLTIDEFFSIFPEERERRIEKRRQAGYAVPEDFSDYNEIAKHFDEKADALKCASERKLEAVSPQTLIKIMKSKR